MEIDLKDYPTEDLLPQYFVRNVNATGSEFFSGVSRSRKMITEIKKLDSLELKRLYSIPDSTELEMIRTDWGKPELDRLSWQRAFNFHRWSISPHQYLTIKEEFPALRAPYQYHLMLRNGILDIVKDPHMARMFQLAVAIKKDIKSWGEPFSVIENVDILIKMCERAEVFLDAIRSKYGDIIDDNHVYKLAEMFMHPSMNWSHGFLAQNPRWRYQSAFVFDMIFNTENDVIAKVDYLYEWYLQIDELTDRFSPTFPAISDIEEFVHDRVPLPWAIDIIMSKQSS